MKKILLLGSSKGIGHALACNLLEKGCYVIGISRSLPSDLMHHNLYEHHPFDLKDQSTLIFKIKQILNEHSQIDAVILNAGRGLLGHLETLSFEDIDDTLHLNLLVPIMVCKMVLPYFRQQGYGDFIFLGSESALEGKQKGSIYCASKFGLRGFAQSLRDETRFQNIRVMMIHPGIVNSPSFFEKLPIEPKQDSSMSLSPEEVARAIDYMLFSPRGVLIEEIMISPEKKQVHFKKNCC